MSGVVWVVLLVVLLVAAPAQSVTYAPGRLCVAEGVDCSRLRREVPELDCTPVRDRVDCLKKMRNNEAEFGYFEAEDLNIAANSFGDKFLASLQFVADKEVKSVYLLVHDPHNTNIKSVCHPGINRQRYYPRALYRPVTSNSDEFLTDIKSQIDALSKSWSKACIPGAWSPDPVTDRQLKQDHPHLCEACLRKNCDAEDHYAGAGAIQCLLEKVADAAFVSDVDFNEARHQNPEVEKLFHYCLIGNGTILPLGDRTINDDEPCDWGKRPLPVLLFACIHDFCDEQRSLYLNALTRHSKIVLEILGLPPDTYFKAIRKPISPSKVLKQSGYKLNLTQAKNPVRFCVHSAAEAEKCEDLRLAAQGYGADAGLGVGCSLTTNASQCYPDIYFGNADVVALDGADVFQVTKDYGFERVLSEVYNVGGAIPTSSYYAVAVVKVDSNITSFSHLEGLKSCHTGIDKTAGWKLPLATLLERRLIDPSHCNYVTAAAEFFTGGSCAPGAKLPTYNTQSNYIDRLCSLCVGEGENHCARSSAEPFYSYTGAFRCLVHGGGDVTFIKHTTVPDNTDGSNTEDWAISLRSENFRLMCPSGGTAAVTEFRTCNLALVPAHEVVVSGRLTEARLSEVRQVLLGVAQVFSPSAPGSKTFKLFGKYQGKSDLLVKNSAVGLRALSEDTPEEIRRKKDYFKKLSELHNCDVRVCALEEQMADCKAMAATMTEEGQQFVCVSARDRLDCVRRVMRGQVDMTPLPGSYLKFNPNLRIIAQARDPVYAADDYRYKAVMVVRRGTVTRTLDLRGKKSCHTAYGRTTGWKIPLAMLKRDGVISPPCNPNQSSLEHEIVAVTTTFNRACVPGTWATITSVDSALKQRYAAMCSMCKSGTCDVNDDYIGYEGALRCLTEKGGDVAFSKLTVVQKFFSNARAVLVNTYGLMCPDGRIVDITSPNASDCFWAARPWDIYVTHGGASEAKVQKLQWALSQSKRKGEADLATRNWYFTTLGIDESFIDIVPTLDNMQTGYYYANSRMNIVEAEEICTDEKGVGFCVTSDDEYKKCDDLSKMLKLRGVSPELHCVRGSDIYNCVNKITLDLADVVSLTDVQLFTAKQQYNIGAILTESSGNDESYLYYLVAVIKKNSGINTASDLAGKTSCHAGHNSSTGGVIDSSLSNCLSNTSDFFKTYTEAFNCLEGADKDVAFVKLPTDSQSGKYAVTVIS
nr:transferrin-like [Cherax quadricarinatus]